MPRFFIFWKIDHRCFGPAGDLEPVDTSRLELHIQRRLELEDGLLACCPFGGDLKSQLPIVVRLQKLECQILQLRLDARHAEAVGQWSVDLAGFESDAGTTFRRQVLQRAHVVEPIAQLDDDDARILGDRQQELPIVLDLLLGGRVKRQARDLGEPVHDTGDLRAELPCDVLHPHVGVFDDIMQQGGHDGGAVQQLFRQDQRHGDGVGNEILSRHPLLAAVGGRAEAERTLDQLEVESVGVPLEHRTQIRGERRKSSCHRSPAAAKLTNLSPAMIT